MKGHASSCSCVPAYEQTGSCVRGLHSTGAHADDWRSRNQSCRGTDSATSRARKRARPLLPPRAHLRPSRTHPATGGLPRALPARMHLKGTQAFFAGLEADPQELALVGTVSGVAVAAQALVSVGDADDVAPLASHLSAFVAIHRTNAKNARQHAVMKHSVAFTARPPHHRRGSEPFHRRG